MRNDLMEAATRECFDAHRKASIALTCWGLFLFAVACFVVYALVTGVPK